MGQASREVIVNLGEVTAVDAAGIGALLSLQAAGFYLTLADPIPTVQQVLARTDLDSVFEITQTTCFGETPPNSTLDRAVV
jgi:anti-anti-sigma regulatory factor